MPRISLFTLCTALALTASGAAQAVDVRINGFLTAGAAMTDAESAVADSPATPADESKAFYNNFIDDQLSFEGDTRIGIQITAAVTPELDVTAQLLAKDAKDTYQVEADWAYASYRLNDSTAVRAGRIKFPIFLASEYQEVGIAYPWVRPPEELYGSVPVKAVSGVDMLKRLRLADADLTLQPLAGNYSEDGVEDSRAEVDADARNLLGLVASLATDAFTLRAAYFTADLDLTVQADVPLGLGGTPPFGSMPIVAADDADYATASAGLHMDWHDVIGYAEYADSDFGDMLGHTKAWYATLGYRMGDWLPHVTYAERDTDTPVDPVPATPPNEAASFMQNQSSIALGLRYNPSANTALKFEAKQVEPEDGTNGLFSTMIDDDKAMVYSIAYDVVF